MRQIVLVEDDRLHRKLYAAWLEARGYQPVTLEDENAAVTTIASLRPCLAIIDVRLPGIDGLDLVRSLRADPATSSTPILVLTVCGTPQDREAALAAGADEHVEKTGQMSAFLAAVETLAGDRA